MTAPSHDGRAARAVGALGRACARHRLLTITSWLLLVVALVIGARLMGTPTDNDVTLPGTDAQLVRDRTGPPATDSSMGTVLLVAPTGRLDSPARVTALDQAATALRRVAHVTAVVPPSAAAGSLSADGRTGWFTVTLDVARSNVTPAMARAAIEAARPATAGLRVLPGGVLAEAADRSAGHRHEYIGLLVAAVVLALALGGLAGAALPMLASLLALIATLATVGLIGNATAVPTVATTLATMVGLGVGIDYSLFLLSRFRELAREGMTIPDAIGRATADSGTAVAFAGVTVAVALGGLALADVPILRTLAWASSIAVLFAVLAALTLLPALAAVAGRRLARGGYVLNRVRRRRTGVNRVGGWARRADRVTRRPWLVGGLALALLAVLAAPALDLRLGQIDAASSPPSTAARQANDVVMAGFGPGRPTPLTVLVELPGPVVGATDDRVLQMVDTLRRQPGVASVGVPMSAPSGGRWIVTVPVVATTAGSDPATADLVHRLRALQVSGADLHVGGTTAARADLAERVTDRMPLVIGVVLLLSMVVLLAAFQAPLVALKAAVMDLISIGAAFGALTAVFSWGWGATWLGLSGPVPIQSYVPLMLFALLFGLSMDYEVFLLTAVRRSWLATGDNLRSVREGLTATGGVITAAATIMVSVFAGFVPDNDPTIKMFGVGMAVAIAVDATIVRGLLAPATMAMLGSITWWTPGSQAPPVAEANAGSRWPGAELASVRRKR